MIISHLKQRPYLKNLKKQECYAKLLSLLPKGLRESIRFVYSKNDTLFFVFEHPSGKMEFNYKRNLIKSLLNKIVELNPECECLHVGQVESFVTNLPPLKDIIAQKDTALCYKERSSGEFKNECQNQKTHQLFEAIRATIKQQNAL
ncbi:MAG: hypothetical protein PHN38_01150 [Sulfurospirillaceae bacterium]|nr:hypothetical protein [Sulfurospirillaceae bacterium]MDD3462378.1 hypothetical protein [Sulfurospirillaceae bacterium]